LGDVRDSDRVYEVMRHVDMVFHAAALKQVPSCELAPLEAFKTNCVGSQNVCSAAIRWGVDRVVGLSTDKAVYPASAMGITKAMMERIVCSQNQQPGDTTFACVRCGNVVGSRGSVVPIWKDRIEKKLPLELTIPSMTRFMMTPRQAAELVLRGLDGRGGEIMIRRLRSCTVMDLANAVACRYSGSPNYPIVETGIRPGERLHDLLASAPEMLRATDAGGGVLAIHAEYDPTEMGMPAEDFSSATAERMGLPEIDQLLDDALSLGR
jgi:FlaA1/EpsC-like NDP-sugar epimerase